MSFRTEIYNELGAYSLPVNTTSRYVELYAEGFFLNELNGSVSSAKLTLSAIADLTDNTSINLNFLTALAKPRILTLLSQGESFNDAAHQASLEILTALGFNYDDPDLFEDMDILKDGESNALLLAASSIIMKVAADNAIFQSSITSELIDLLTRMKTDICDNGILDDTDLIEMIQIAVASVNAAGIKSQLEDIYLDMDAGITIPDFSQFIAENDNFQESEFAGSYKLEFNNWGFDEYIDLTIYNQYNISGMHHVPDLQFTGFVYNATLEEDGTLSFRTSPVSPDEWQFTGTISLEDGTIEGTCYVDGSDLPGPYDFTGYKLQ